MLRFCLILGFLSMASAGIAEVHPDMKMKTIPAESDTTKTTNVQEIDTSMSLSDEAETEIKPGKDDKSEDDGVDKESLGYKIGYQIGSWLIPGILMVIVSILIFRRSRRGERTEL